MYAVTLSAKNAYGDRTGTTFDVVNVLHSGVLYCYNLRPGGPSAAPRAVDEVWYNGDQWVKIERIGEP